MKRSFFLSIACATALLANDTIVLKEITTISTATKSEKNIDGVSASVIVIDEEDIKRSGAESLKDIITQTPGLSVQYGTFPSASSASKSSLALRGMGAKGTLLLVDGRRISGEVSNPYDLDRLPASQIERIEIVKGPMSTLYGADATGGVVNIITKKPKDGSRVDLGVRYGANGDGDDENKNANIAVRGKVDKLGYSFYVNETHTSPYTQSENADVYAKQGAAKVKPSAHGNPAVHALPDSYTNESVTYREKSEVSTQGGRLTYDITDNIVAGVEFNHFSETREGSYIGYFHPTNYASIPAYNVPVNSKDDNERLDVGADLKIKASDELSLMLRAYNSSYEKRSTTTAKYWADMGYASEAASAQNGMNANVDITAYEASATYFLTPEHLLTLGVERRFEEREGSVFTLANTMNTKKVDYSAVYVQDEWQATKDLSIVLGGRFDEISNADDKPTFKIGAVNRFDEALHVRANIAQGYRTPDIRELYIYKNTPSGAQRGSEVIDASVGKLSTYSLSPEFTNSYEIGASGNVGVGKYDVAFFYNDIEDMISEVNKGAYYTFENIPQAKTYGMEASWMQPLLENLDLSLAWTELRSKNKQSGKELEFTPERTLGAKFLYSFTKNLSSDVGVNYIGEQFYRKTQNRGTPSESIVDATTNDYMTLNWGIRYALDKTTTVYGGINNITDEGVDNVLGSNSGRYFFMGVKVSL
jgi:outer membrane receptor for ferrienterochelin and colicins